jgi:hypothetical protein
MSIHNSDPWFGRGQTALAGPGRYAGYEGSSAATDPRSGTSYLGSVKVFSDVDPRATNTGIVLSNRLVTCVAVRNTSGVALIPGAVVKFKKSAILTEVDGPATAVADAPIGVVDEYLPASGVANGDIFWLVTSGPVAVMCSATFAPTAGALVGVGAGGAAVAGAAGTSIGVAISPKVLGKVRTLTNVAAEGGSIVPVSKGADDEGTAEPVVTDPTADVAAFSTTVEPVVAPVATPVVEPVVAPVVEPVATPVVEEVAPVVPEAAPVVEPVVAPEAPVVTEPTA